MGKLRVRGICALQEPVLATYAFNLNTALYVDVGYSKTTVAGVVDGLKIDNVRSQFPLCFKSVLSLLEYVFVSSNNIDA